MPVTIPQERLRSLIHRHETITAMLAAGPDASEIVRLSRELAGLFAQRRFKRSEWIAHGDFTPVRCLGDDCLIELADVENPPAQSTAAE